MANQECGLRLKPHKTAGIVKLVDNKKPLRGWAPVLLKLNKDSPAEAWLRCKVGGAILVSELTMTAAGELVWCAVVVWLSPGLRR
mmetsp:Transcript_8446/g.20764  ORF Transcript_8446/g.20764 Transcript_8446/m.20764 type:complete len:85 (-) Transcript_8446:211-465(-)